MNEWEFTGEAASWIKDRIQKNPSLPFSDARTEQRGAGSLKRRDLTLLDKSRVPVLTGELKLPYAKDGGTPYNDAVVTDARARALRAGARFFFTWNVNEFVLWETTPDKGSFQDQKYKSWLVTAVHKESHLDIEPTRQAIQSWLDKFLVEFADVIRGTAPIGFKPPDERFIDLLESALRTPIAMTFETLLSRYSDLKFKKDLDKWMREEGWTILDDQEGINENLERAAKYACYALVNKLVFHEALLKRYGAKMDSLTVPEHIDAGDQLRLHLETYFENAKNVTGDYETVFGEDHKAVENRIPFYSDTATPHWRELINQIHKFDFSKIDYEVIGRIFERLISPEERHKYGKYYTRAEVVDLINSFCIQNGTEAVMDPACGGGTFLVRAYARKKELCPARKHVQLLADLFGVDVSHFATHLTTINLATRDLIDEENYPQIARSDFFDVATHKTFISLPKRVETKTLGKRREVTIPALDAVISNPPYVRQEDIPRSKKDAKNGPKRGTKEYYQKLVKDEAGVTFSGRADLHCYFWPHSASFLKENGYLCLLTSSQWLDVEYGFRLQGWILSDFRILAVFESIDEPWFEHMIRKYIAPNLGNIHLTALKPEHLLKYYSDRRAAGLAGRTVHHHHVTLHGALKAAVKWGLIVRNPAGAIDPPRFNKPEMHTIGEDDLQRFLDAAEQTEYYPLFYTALFTGMRRSELLALRWMDVDLILCQIHVTRSLHHLRTGETVFRPTKTAKSRRSVALSPSTVQVLREYKAKQESERFHVGKLLQEDDLIFPWLPDTVTHAWLKLARRVGLNGVRFHDARHTHASLLLKQNVHPDVVQQRLGHASIATTIDVYSHIMPGLQAAAANGFDDFVRSRGKDIPEKFVAKSIVNS